MNLLAHLLLMVLTNQPLLFIALRRLSLSFDPVCRQQKDHRQIVKGQATNVEHLSL